MVSLRLCWPLCDNRRVDWPQCGVACLRAASCFSHTQMAVTGDGGAGMCDSEDRLGDEARAR